MMPTHSAAEPAATGTPEERPRAPHGSVRSCVGCGARVELGAKGAEPLVRLILGPDGQVAVDGRGGGFGRGAHVHPRRDCLERAVRQGLARAAKGRVETLVLEEAADPSFAQGENAADGGSSVPLSAASLARAIEAAMARRIVGLLAAAVRSKRATFGSDAVCSSLQRGDAALVIVAVDAAAGAERGEVRRAIADGRAIAWGTKERLGEICRIRGTDAGAGVALVAITSTRIAGALRESVTVLEGCARPRGGQALAGNDLGPRPRTRGARGAGGEAGSDPNRRGDAGAVSSDVERGA